jgi:hypothetical protein
MWHYKIGDPVNENEQYTATSHEKKKKQKETRYQSSMKKNHHVSVTSDLNCLFFFHKVGGRIQQRLHSFIFQRAYFEVFFLETRRAINYCYLISHLTLSITTGSRGGASAKLRAMSIG